MAAPTATGNGYITASGESNGILFALKPGVDQQFIVGFSGGPNAGTFAGVSVVVRGAYYSNPAAPTTTEFYPLGGQQVSPSNPVDGTSFTIADNTNASYLFNCNNVQYIEVYVASGTLGGAGLYCEGSPSQLEFFQPQIVNAVAGGNIITSSSANAFAVGPNGSTNPSFQVDASTASSATGIKVKSAAAAGGVAVSVISSGSNEALKVDGKGTGTIGIGTVSTGAITLGTAVTCSSTLTVTGATALNAAVTLTAASAAALAVGANGGTNPAFVVNTNTGSVATGASITGAAAAGGVAIAAISSGTNEPIKLDGKGSGLVQIGSISTGNVNLGGGGGIVVLPGTLTAGGLLTCALQVATSGPLIYSGSGAPTINAAVKGSIYLRSDGSSVATRLYVASDTAGGWAAVTTAS